MTFLSALFFAAAIASGHCVPINTAQPQPEQIKELIAAAIVYQTSLLPKLDPVPLRDFIKSRYTIPEIDTDVTGEGKHGKAYGVNKFLIDQYEFDPSTSATKFRLTTPNVTEEYDYELEGTIFGHKAFGKGLLKLEVIGNGYVVSDLRFEEVSNSLQIASLNLAYVLDKVVVELGGLHVETITVQQLEELAADYMTSLFTEGKEERGKMIAESVKSEFNKDMSGYSIEQVIEWLKEHTKKGVQNEILQEITTGFMKVQI